VVLPSKTGLPRLVSLRASKPGGNIGEVANLAGRHQQRERLGGVSASRHRFGSVLSLEGRSGKGAAVARRLREYNRDETACGVQNRTPHAACWLSQVYKKTRP
jgi:hypothetical protein